MRHPIFRIHTVKFTRLIVLALLCLLAFGQKAEAQFKEEAFTQTYVDPNDTTQIDTAAAMFTFKNYFRGIAHKEPVKIGNVLAGSTVFVGGYQVYNKQYWKIPVIYAGLGTTLGMGFHYRSQYTSSVNAYNAALPPADVAPGLLTAGELPAIDKKAQHLSNYFFAGAAAIWWGSLLDGVINFDKDIYPQPGKATVYSVLCPGLGQIYNHEAWKLPIYWGGLIGSYHFYQTNKTNYLKYKKIYNDASNPEIHYTGQISGETALYYRNVFRRYRDYSVLAMAAFYLLQVIDANVFCYMQDFDMSEDLAVSVSPTVITPDNAYAFGGSSPGTGLGFRIGFTF